MSGCVRLLAVGSIICGTLAPSVAQQHAGPATRENPMQAGARRPTAVPDTAATVASPKRPALAAVRPQDGVKHPDLDTAWSKYDGVVAKAGEGIRAGLSRQFDAATAKGDLDAAEKWQKALETFQKNGELPGESDVKATVGAAVADCKKAKEELVKAYEAVVKSLTMEKNITQAKVVRDEMRRLSAPVAATEPKPAPNSVEGIWRWGKHVMVFYPGGTTKEFFPDKGGSPVAGRWKATADKEITIRLDNGYVVVCAAGDGDSMTASCKSPEGRTHDMVAKKISQTSSMWRWFNGGFVELCGDGCVNGNPACRWRRDGGRVIITWPAGWVDTLSLSPDGSRLAGTNQNGAQVSGERIR